ncbi:hypothetical protein P4O66_008590 [Electrophorus voltai]|uniref:Secreted protein n=1 Tax=Electrophorus voltai TaxID=2609070 RepID=A0AAD8ZGP1_9TELE|nr:hypothetical protein P4O66_008590 [Electrophorus voltai]
MAFRLLLYYFHFFFFFLLFLSRDGVCRTFTRGPTVSNRTKLPALGWSFMPQCCLYQDPANMGNVTKRTEWVHQS